jgi:hypothetical protein
MSHETPMLLPPPPVRIEVPALIPPPADTALAPPTPEQIERADAVFARAPSGQAEAHAVEGLLCLWSGTLLLHDLAKEHFGKARNREEEEQPLALKPVPGIPGV